MNVLDDLPVDPTTISPVNVEIPEVKVSIVAVGDINALVIILSADIPPTTLSPLFT